MVAVVGVPLLLVSNDCFFNCFCCCTCILIVFVTLFCFSAIYFFFLFVFVGLFVLMGILQYLLRSVVVVVLFVL